MINENKSVRDLKRMVLIGAIVALVSQLYWNLFVYNFRISSSVIVLPVLLMTLGKKSFHDDDLFGNCSDRFSVPTDCSGKRRC